jgi:hypothetical protein
MDYKKAKEEFPDLHAEFEAKVMQGLFEYINKKSIEELLTIKGYTPQGAWLNDTEDCITYSWGILEQEVRVVKPVEGLPKCPKYNELILPDENNNCSLCETPLLADGSHK